MKYPKPMREPDEVDWARLAAFIDGEGCIYLSAPKQKSGKITYLFVSVTNTDPRLISWLGTTFGGIAYGNPQKNTNIKWSLAYKWVISGRKAVPILERCLPYFVMKRDQAEVGLAHQQLVGKHMGKGKRVPQEVLDQRLALRDELSLLKGTHSRRQDLRSTTIN